MQHMNYPNYQKLSSDEERLVACIEFEIRQGGDYHAVAKAILRDVELGYILQHKAKEDSTQDTHLITAMVLDYYGFSRLHENSYRVMLDDKLSLDVLFVSTDTEVIIHHNALHDVQVFPHCRTIADLQALCRMLTGKTLEEVRG